MAEAIWAERLGKLHGGKVTVESAGIAALVGKPADPLAVELMTERGLELSRHRARQLSPELAMRAELILVMEEGHRRAVEQMIPMARGRVHRLGRWGNFDVPDPYRHPRAAFEEALGLIDRGLADFEKAFFATVGL
ncbi:MAG: low molecular weight phosphotyrosine protein phosphatase [Myxococcota bacterium]|nr:low molecular weight phosphotyrosine protein phosphatase [Myxococcota bacterium]